MKKILFILILLFSISLVVDAKPKYNGYKAYTTYKKKKNKNKSKVYHFNPNQKHKKCKLSKYYKVK